MSIRTDLALESREALGEGEIEGVSCTKESDGKVSVTRIEISDERGEKKLGKPKGRYITVEMPDLSNSAGDGFDEAHILARELGSLLPKEGTVLVAGLGNADITPDALGPLCANAVFATRHIGAELSKKLGLGKLRPAAAVIPGVLGKTGIETVEILSGIAESIKPAAVITVDALAARSLKRLGCTVQMTDTGIVPGSGVGNSRRAVNRELIGVPVIAVGVPTVVDAATLAYDLTQGEGKPEISAQAELMMVTPREIDALVARAAQITALAINICVQPHIDARDLIMLVQQ